MGEHTIYGYNAALKEVLKIIDNTVATTDSTKTALDVLKEVKSEVKAIRYRHGDQDIGAMDKRGLSK